MDNNDNQYGFSIPEAFLTQLGEYTRGYMLLVCNEKGELFAHESYDNPVIKIGLVNFAEIHASAALKHMKNMALKEEEEEPFEDFGDDSDTSELG